MPQADTQPTTGWIGRRRTDERGAILIIATFAMVALAATAAVALDLAVARSDRAESQVGVDAAVAAAGFVFIESGTTEACEAAFAYLELNLGETLTGHDCSTVSRTCESNSPTVEVVATGPGMVARFVHPIQNGHRMMNSSAAGNPMQDITDGDGPACDRFGVEIERDWKMFLAPLIGAEDSQTRVHAVMRASLIENHDRPIHLLLTGQNECRAIQTNGSGNSGGLFVSAVTDPTTGQIHPGFIASDSDATVGCADDGVIDVDGSNAPVRADGLPGCAGELVPGTGQGCGTIEVFAGGGCEHPVCSGSGQVNPDPSLLPHRITRSPIDHRYNCEPVYPSTPGIRPCADAPTTPSYIDQLESALGGNVAPMGYQDYEVDGGFSCSIGGGPTAVVIVPEGNWWVGCSDLRVSRTLVFEGGNIVLAGDLTLGSSGEMIVNSSNTGSYEWREGDAFDPEQSSANAALLVLQSGSFRKAGGARMRMENTMIYSGPDSQLDFTGGSGDLIWTAPTEGPFEDLAFWTESANDHRFAGQANLQMTGIFFAPNADVQFRGNGQDQVIQAQMIARSVELSGNGSLRLAPQFERMVLFSWDGTSGLIR